MHTILRLTVAFGLLACTPVLARADDPATSRPVVVAATTSAPPSGSLLQRLFSPAPAPKTANTYGDPFDAGVRKPGQIIVVPIGG